jgi:hypothetical protein
MIFPKIMDLMVFEDFGEDEGRIKIEDLRDRDIREDSYSCNSEKPA